MNDDQLLLASAYLDDDVDVAGRARAEADPEVMAEITRLRAVRDALREVGEPDATRRERAIGAALAAFGEEPSAPVATTAVVPLPRRSRRGWWGALAAAAAVVVVAAGAIALRGGGTPDGDDSAASATASLENARQDASLAAPNDSSRDAAAPAPQAGESEADTGRAPAATVEAPVAAGSAPQVAAALPVLTTPAELAAFAAAAAADADAADAPGAASDSPACSHPGTFVGTARYGDVVVEVFDDGALVSALSATTCGVVAEVER